MKRNLLDLDAAGLTAFFEQIGEKPFRARQVLKWIHQQGEGDFAHMSDLAKSLREKLSGVARIHAPTVVGDVAALDGTRKWLMKVDTANAIEAVFIPETNRGTLCVSSQAGCVLDCAFCSTGKQGFNRNLNTAEPSNVAREPRVARNQILHDATHPSKLVLWQLPAAGQ